MMTVVYKARNEDERLDLDPATGEAIVVPKESMSEIAALILVAIGIVAVSGITIALITILCFSDLLYKI